MNMKNFIFTLVLMVLSTSSALAQQQSGAYVRLWGSDGTNQASPTNPLPVGVTSTVQPTGNTGALMTSITAGNTGVAQTVTLAAPSTNITILAAPNGPNVHVTFSGAATTSNFTIPAAFAFTFTGLPAQTSFSIISDTAGGTYSVFAH